MEPKHIHNDEEEEKKVIKRINKKMSGFIIKGHSKNVGDWGLGIGDWGLGIGDWGLCIGFNS